MPKKKTIKAWAGIIGTGKRERIDKTLEYYGDERKIYAIYPSKKMASKLYEEFVQVEIIILK